MEVNLKKTKVMIFQKGNKKLLKPSFTFDNKTIEIVRKYCYLEIKLNMEWQIHISNETTWRKGTPCPIQYKKTPQPSQSIP